MGIDLKLSGFSFSLKTYMLEADRFIVHIYQEIRSSVKTCRRNGNDIPLHEILMRMTDNSELVLRNVRTIASLVKRAVFQA